MRVNLIECTNNPEVVVAHAKRTCVGRGIHDIKDYYQAVRDAICERHLSVLEHVSFTFLIEDISRACSHQLVRHRLASYSQQSQRWVSPRGIITPESIRCKPAAFDTYLNCIDEINRAYNKLLELDVPKEDARYLLPHAMCTSLVMTVNARELLHMADERLCLKAQWEIRELMDKIRQIVSEEFPVLGEEMNPKCVRLGYCPEKKGCGRYKKRELTNG